jgi:hypothetical protein
MWEPKYGVVLAKFVTHQARIIARIKINPFYPFGHLKLLFLENIQYSKNNLAIQKPMVQTICKTELRCKK